MFGWRRESVHWTNEVPIREEACWGRITLVAKIDNALIIKEKQTFLVPQTCKLQIYSWSNLAILIKALQGAANFDAIPTQGLASIVAPQPR